MMNPRIRLEKVYFQPTDPEAPALKPIKQWSQANQGFYDRFRDWLRQGGYSEGTLNQYSAAARLALGLLEQAYWQLDPDTDLQVVYDNLNDYINQTATRRCYRLGLDKLAQYLRQCRRQPPPEKPVNWAYYGAGLPDWLVDDLHTFIAHRRRGWLPDVRRRRALDLLSHLTLFLRWLVEQIELTAPAQITPERWFDYVDERLQAGITPRTLNGQLAALQHFLRLLAEQERPVCERLLKVAPLADARTLPKDVPVTQLRQLAAEIEKDAASPHAGVRRMGLMDRAWFLLMLHSGLRTGEVRRLRQSDLNLNDRRIRIEQSKGLKDRMVYLSQPTIDALQAYFVVRGPAGSEHVFLYRHRPLGVTYCLQRLQTYGGRCGLQVRPHQLRHSCATLLLNAGAPVLTVQLLLGHKFVDTTLRYARLYDGTVASDYYRAMAHIERRFEPGEPAAPPDPAQLLAMVDSLQNGTLNDRQRETVQQLRDGLLAMQPEQVLDRLPEFGP